jgi:hypothetical protein
MPKNDGKELERLKRLEDQFAKKKAALIAAKGHIKELDRKNRAKRLFRVGTLTQTAQIFEHDDAALLGGFLHLAKIMAEQDTLKKFKAVGQKKLSEAAKKLKEN